MGMNKLLVFGVLLALVFVLTPVYAQEEATEEHKGKKVVDDICEKCNFCKTESDCGTGCSKCSECSSRKEKGCRLCRKGEVWKNAQRDARRVAEYARSLKAARIGSRRGILINICGMLKK